MRGKGTIIVGVAMVVFVLMFAAAGILLFRGISRFNSAEKKADTLYRQLEAFYRRNPFPSEPNVATVRDNAEKMNAWVDALLSELRRTDVEVEERSPSRFMSVLGKTRNELLAMATAQGTTLRGEFGFGFDSYLGDGNELPPPSIVPALTRQLVVVDAVARILMTNRVAAIERIEREDVAGAPADPVGRGGGSRRVAGRAARRAALQEEPPEEVPSDLYRKMEFTFEFLSVERVLMSVLNDLMRERGFVTVSSLTLKREGPGVLEQVTGEATEVPTVGPDGRPSTTLVWPPKNERVISGPGQETPMRVEMKIEVYRFAGEGDRDAV